MAILRSLPVLLAADAAFRLAAGLLRGAGLVLLPWGLFVAWCATRPARGPALAVVAINLLWAADSVVLLLLGWVAPTPAGTGFILALPPASRLSHA